MSFHPKLPASSWLRAAIPCLLSAVLFVSFAANATPAAAEATSRDCLRCHAMATLGYRDPETWKIVDLSVDPHEFTRSVHRQLGCVDCHAEDYRRYPHPRSVQNEQSACTDCHDDDAAVQAKLARIAAELAASVHGETDTDAGDDRPLDCYSCHDPHRQRPAGADESLATIVRRHNQICLGCHRQEDGQAQSQQTDTDLPPHAWLPNRDAHWRAVRCLECHTPAGAQASHLVEPAETAARNCVGCHSQSADLLGRLYAFRAEEEVTRRGWLARAIFNEAYVVGMSRSPTIDRLSLLVLAGVAGLLAAHGLGRWLAARARRKKA